MKYYDLFLVNKVTMTGMNLGIFTILFLQEMGRRQMFKI